MKNVTETIKRVHLAVMGPDTEMNSWAWRSAAINVSIVALALVVTVALLTLLMVYLPDEHRWTTLGLVAILDVLIFALMAAHGRVSIELKALETLHKDVLGALTPDTAKVLLTKWSEEIKDNVKKEGGKK